MSDRYRYIIRPAINRFLVKVHLMPEDVAMLQSIEDARHYSIIHATAYCASNGHEVIWGPDRSCSTTTGYWLCAAFNKGKEVDF